MSLSNRVSLDTDVVFLRNIFMFSTNTNNVPVSTNFIMAAGQYGQIGAVDTLRNIEAYGVGYLPSTFSTFNGQMLSISSNVASSFVNSNQLFSVQNFLFSSISSTNADLNAFSSYVVNELVPSTVSGITFALSSLNSSFQGYVVGTTIIQEQLFSTTAGLIIDTGNQISSYSTIDGTALAGLSNFFVTNGVNNIAFINLSTYVSTFAASTNFSLISTGQNFTALSNFVRLTTASNSTFLFEISTTVSELVEEVDILSSLAQDPLFVIGTLSSLNNVRFGSNVTISSINSNYKFGINTFTGPSLFMSTGTFSSLSAATGFISSFGASRISTGGVVAETLSSMALHTSSIVANTLGVNTFAVNDGFVVNTFSSASVLTSSVRAQQISLNTVGSNYALDVGGDINFSGTIFNNGAVFPPATIPVNVLGTLSTAAASDVWFNSNINVSSINGNLFLSNGRLGIGAQPTTFPLEVTGTAQISFSVLTDNISTGFILGGQMSSVQIFTSSLQANGIIAEKLQIPVLNTTTVNATTANTFVVNSDNISTGFILGGQMSSVQIFTSSLQALQVAVGTIGSNYALDVGGDINFSGTMFQNGVIYPAGGSGTVNVLGTLSTAAASDVWFNSNINVSSINGGIFLSNGGIGIGTQTGIAANGLIATGNVVIGGTATLSNTLNVIGQATFSNIATPVRMSNLASSNSIDFSLTGTGGPYITLQSSDAIGTGQNYPMLTFSNSGTGRRFRLGLGNNDGGNTGGWTNNQLTLYTRSNTSEDISLTVGSNGFIGIGAPANLSNRLAVTGTAFVSNNFAAGSNTATTNVFFVDDANNNVGVNCNAPGASNAFAVHGSAFVASNFAAGSNTTTNVFFVDDATNFVGINCNAPTVALDINGQTKINENLTVGTNLLFVNTVDSKVGINTASFGTERFKVDGTALITSNLIAGSNAGVANLLFVNDASNSVGINCNAPNSAFALDVNGAANFRSNISTTYTVQTEPRVWSYANVIGTGGPVDPVNLNIILTKPSDISDPYSSYFYFPYSGIYRIDVNGNITNGSNAAGTIELTFSNTSGSNSIWTQSVANGGGTTTIGNVSFSYTSNYTFINTPRIFLKYTNSVGINLFNNSMLTVTYLG